MGGRGASSGGRTLKDGTYLPYGSEYTTLLEEGRIKFVTANFGSNTAPLETMTNGRIYVTVNKETDELKSITFYDSENKREKQIDLDHYHKIDGKAVKPHTQQGYYHNGEASRLTKEEQNLLDRVRRIWNNRHSKS